MLHAAIVNFSFDWICLVISTIIQVYNLTTIGLLLYARVYLKCLNQLLSRKNKYKKSNNPSPACPPLKYQNVSFDAGNNDHSNESAANRSTVEPVKPSNLPSLFDMTLQKPLPNIEQPHKPHASRCWLYLEDQIISTISRIQTIIFLSVYQDFLNYVYNGQDIKGGKQPTDDSANSQNKQKADTFETDTQNIGNIKTEGSAKPNTGQDQGSSLSSHEYVKNASSSKVDSRVFEEQSYGKAIPDPLSSLKPISCIDYYSKDYESEFNLSTFLAYGDRFLTFNNNYYIYSAATETPSVTPKSKGKGKSKSSSNNTQNNGESSTAGHTTTGASSLNSSGNNLANPNSSSSSSSNESNNNNVFCASQLAYPFNNDNYDALQDAEDYSPPSSEEENRHHYVSLSLVQKQTESERLMSQNNDDSMINFAEVLRDPLEIPISEPQETQAPEASSSKQQSKPNPNNQVNKVEGRPRGRPRKIKQIPTEEQVDNANNAVNTTHSQEKTKTTPVMTNAFPSIPLITPPSPKRQNTQQNSTATANFSTPSNQFSTSPLETQLSFKKAYVSHEDAKRVISIFQAQNRPYKVHRNTPVRQRILNDPNTIVYRAIDGEFTRKPFTIVTLDEATNSVATDPTTPAAGPSSSPINGHSRNGANNSIPTQRNQHKSYQQLSNESVNYQLLNTHNMINNGSNNTTAVQNGRAGNSNNKLSEQNQRELLRNTQIQRERMAARQQVNQTCNQPSIPGNSNTPDSEDERAKILEQKRALARNQMKKQEALNLQKRYQQQQQQQQQRLQQQQQRQLQQQQMALFQTRNGQASSSNQGQSDNSISPQQRTRNVSAQLRLQQQKEPARSYGSTSKKNELNGQQQQASQMSRLTPSQFMQSPSQSSGSQRQQQVSRDIHGRPTSISPLAGTSLLVSPLPCRSLSISSGTLNPPRTTSISPQTISQHALYRTRQDCSNPQMRPNRDTQLPSSSSSSSSSQSSPCLPSTSQPHTNPPLMNHHQRRLSDQYRPKVSSNLRMSCQNLANGQSSNSSNNNSNLQNRGSLSSAPLVQNKEATTTTNNNNNNKNSTSPQVNQQEHMKKKINDMVEAAVRDYQQQLLLQQQQYQQYQQQQQQKKQQQQKQKQKQKQQQQQTPKPNEQKPARTYTESEMAAVHQYYQNQQQQQNHFNRMINSNVQQQEQQQQEQQQQQQQQQEQQQQQQFQFLYEYPQLQNSNNNTNKSNTTTTTTHTRKKQKQEHTNGRTAVLNLQNPNTNQNRQSNNSNQNQQSNGYNTNQGEQPNNPNNSNPNQQLNNNYNNQTSSGISYYQQNGSNQSSSSKEGMKRRQEGNEE